MSQLEKNPTAAQRVRELEKNFESLYAWTQSIGPRVASLTEDVDRLRHDVRVIANLLDGGNTVEVVEN